jgi:hypothetical protein
VTSHAFRKTAATELDRAGLSARQIADQLGHSKVSMAQDRYLGRGAVGEEAAAALDRAHRAAQREADRSRQPVRTPIPLASWANEGASCRLVPVRTTRSGLMIMREPCRRYRRHRWPLAPRAAPPGPPSRGNPGCSPRQGTRTSFPRTWPAWLMR